MSPSFANNSVYSIVSTGGGVIDGRFSFSAGTPGDGFVAVEVSERECVCQRVCVCVCVCSSSFIPRPIGMRRRKGLVHIAHTYIAPGDPRKRKKQRGFGYNRMFAPLPYI